LASVFGVGLRAARHVQHLIVAGLAVHLATRARAAVFGVVAELAAQVREIAARGVDLEDDIATVAAVAAVYATARNVRLATHGRRAVAAPACPDDDRDPIVKR